MTPPIHFMHNVRRFFFLILNQVVNLATTLVKGVKT